MTEFDVTIYVRMEGILAAKDLKILELEAVIRDEAERNALNMALKKGTGDT